MRNKQSKELLRILDANFNRSREGLRVCEDICRFVWNDSKLSNESRTLRHSLSSEVKKFKYYDLLASRNSSDDVGRYPHRWEEKRSAWMSLFAANIQRVKEAVRVLEEISKLEDVSISRRLKKIRFKVYGYEKRCSSKI